jgi:hypothetical protein
VNIGKYNLQKSASKDEYTKVDSNMTSLMASNVFGLIARGNVIYLRVLVWKKKRLSFALLFSALVFLKLI